MQKPLSLSVLIFLGSVLSCASDRYGGKGNENPNEGAETQGSNSSLDRLEIDEFQAILLQLLDTQLTVNDALDDIASIKRTRCEHEAFTASSPDECETKQNLVLCDTGETDAERDRLKNARIGISLDREGLVEGREDSLTSLLTDFREHYSECGLSFVDYTRHLANVASVNEIPRFQERHRRAAEKSGDFSCNTANWEEQKVRATELSRELDEIEAFQKQLKSAESTLRDIREQGLRISCSDLRDSDA